MPSTPRRQTQRRRVLPPLNRNMPRSTRSGRILTTTAGPSMRSPKITSSFAEFRSSHFHAGIESERATGSELKFTLRAMATSPALKSPRTGTEGILVLRHADGFYTTYAHLSAFKDDLERAVRAEQLKRGKFSVEMKFQPGEYPVRKGTSLHSAARAAPAMLTCTSRSGTRISTR